MEILALLCLIAAAVWSVILLRWGHVLTLGAIVLLAGTFFGPDFYHYNGPFQVSSERILWCALLGFFVIHWRLGRTDVKPMCAIDWLVVAFTVFTGISTQFGIPVTDGSNPVARWLFFVAMPTGFYFVAKNSSIREQDIRLLSNFLLGIGIYIAIMAVLETRGLHGLVFPRYIVNPKHWEFFGRGRGPLLNPAGVGIVMTSALGTALMRWYGSGRIGRLGYGVAVLVLLIGCYSTYTRCVWIGAFLTVALIVYLHSSKLFRLWAASAGIIAVLGLGSVAVQAVLEFKRDKNLSAEASKASVELRPLLAIVAIEMFQDRPLTGHGFGHYMEAHKKYVENTQWELPLKNALHFHQHNIFLSILADCGIVVMLIYMAMVVSWFTIAKRLFDRKLHPDLNVMAFGTMAMLVGYVANGMFQDVTIIPMVNMYVWFFSSICVGVYVRGSLAQAVPLLPSQQFAASSITEQRIPMLG